MSGPATGQLRSAAAFVAGGLLVQLVASIHWTPLAFIVASTVGLPAVLIGGALFLRAVLVIMKSKGAL
jgi:hypothetical protein